jgi:calcineurin-like phosphoesterase family protein
MIRRGILFFTAFVALLLLILETRPSAQLAPAVAARPIDPGGIRLPLEADSGNQTKFSFITYGDTRGPADGVLIQAAHRDVVNRILASIPEQERAGFPVRFVVQSGDAVVTGRSANQWNVSFNPLIERLIHDGGVPYLLVVGNHDVGGMPVRSPERDAGLRNASAAMAQLWPQEGTSRRLTGYPTFAFGYGRYFFIALDSNIAADPAQFTWVKNQLETLDRQRFRHVVAVFHHPVLTTGPHGGPLVEPPSQVLRRIYMPLFRTHHVRMTITGHDHLFDRFVEHYEDASGMHRMDHVVSGGGGAPIYSYRGEQDLQAYSATAVPLHVTVEHPVRPGVQEADNPHHFVIFEVDGDRLWLKVVTTVAAPFNPQPTKIELVDTAADERDAPATRR